MASVKNNVGNESNWSIGVNYPVRVMKLARARIMKNTILRMRKMHDRKPHSVLNIYRGEPRISPANRGESIGKNGGF